MKWLLKLLLPALLMIWCFCAGATPLAFSEPGVNEQTPSGLLVAKKKKKKKKKKYRKKRKRKKKNVRRKSKKSSRRKRKSKAPATKTSPLKLKEKTVKQVPAGDSSSPGAWDSQSRPQTQNDPWPDSFGDAEKEDSGAQDKGDDVSFDPDSLDTPDEPSTTYPISKIARPLVLPPMLLEAHAGLQMDFIGLDVNDVVALQLGGTIGVIDKFEAGMFLPFMFAPEVNLGEFRLFGKYDLGDLVRSLLGNKFDLAVRATAAAPISDSYLQWLGTDFVFVVDAPIRYHLSGSLALVGDFSLGIAIAEKVGVPLFLDVGALFQAMENLSVEGLLGLHFWIGSDDSYTMVPLKVRGTYTLLPNLDVVLDLGFFDFNEFEGKYFQIMLGAAYRLKL